MLGFMYKVEHPSVTSYATVSGSHNLDHSAEGRGVSLVTLFWTSTSKCSAYKDNSKYFSLAQTAEESYRSTMLPYRYVWGEGVRFTLSRHGFLVWGQYEVNDPSQQMVGNNNYLSRSTRDTHTQDGCSTARLIHSSARGATNIWPASPTLSASTSTRSTSTAAHLISSLTIVCR